MKASGGVNNGCSLLISSFGFASNIFPKVKQLHVKVLLNSSIPFARFFVYRTTKWTNLFLK